MRGSASTVLPSVAVIVPARNESSNLPRLLQSLAEQSVSPKEIIVANDASTDDTATLATRQGARVVDVVNRPDGANGKSWAMWQASQQASAELLIFLDADTWLHADAIERITTAWQRTRGLLTVQPFHVVHRAYEQLSALLNVMVWTGHRGGAFGPCVVCARDDYQRVGGHAACVNERLDACGLARLFRQHGLPVENGLGESLVAYRMYPSGLREQFAGWSKTIAAGSTAVGGRELIASMVWLAGIVTSAAWLLLTGSAFALVAYLGTALQLRWLFRRAGTFWTMTAVLYALPLLFFLVVFAHSWVATTVLKRSVWKGREIS